MQPELLSKLLSGLSGGFSGLGEGVDMPEVHIHVTRRRVKH